MTRLAIPSKEIQLHIVGPLEQFKVSRVQRLTLNTDIPSTTVDELGNSAHVGDSKDTPNVTLTFSVLDVGIKAFAVLTGTNMASYPPTGVDIATLDEVDAIIFIKDESLASYVKSAHARRLQIRDFAFNYSVDGEATEDYTAIGSEKRWLANDVQVNTFAPVGNPYTYTATQTPLVLKNGNYYLSVVSDGNYLTETHTPTPAAGYYYVNTVAPTGVVLNVADEAASKVHLIYQVATASPDWVDVSDTQSEIAIKGKDIDITIAANEIPRVQSVTINGTLNVQPVKEMGNRNIVGYQRQVPEVTGTITVLDTDTELISLLQYGATSSGTEYAPGEGCTQSAVTLTIKLVDPCDDISPIATIKTVYLDSITVVGDSYTSNVNQNVQQTFNFKSLTGHCAVYSGDM